MGYLALASDYDGTLATHGRLDEPTCGALERWRAAGRKLLLVTGRELEELQSICPRLDLFDRVVAENGGLLYRPPGGVLRLLAPPPPARLIETLRARGFEAFSVGRTLIATWTTHKDIVLEALRELALPHQVILNKDAIMVLPPGVDKATGLGAALEEMGRSPQEVVGIGDAENDLAFLALCGRSVAVANALPLVKERVDQVTVEARGRGVMEVIDQILTGEGTTPMGERGV
jgi:hydroxymethylpyrimidine pyrophosphatase-like HAD family hydrolase